ncbi:MAG: hypothetical protein M1817_004432 [Caeruleum heppii]|nr:MAG: hypothetical protein M1817_004432 [Caeruleum heppii]
MSSQPPKPGEAPKTFSISLGASKTKPKPKPKPSLSSRAPLSQTNGTKRPGAALQDSDDEDDAPHNQQPELVSAFDHAAGGAITVKPPDEAKAPLVIARIKNRDWREESRRKRGRNLLPQEVQDAQRSGAGVPTDKETEGVNGGPQSFGLNIMERTETDLGMTSASIITAENGSVKAQTNGETTTTTLAKTEDELALEALTGDGATRKSNLVLPALDADDNSDAPDEWRTRLGNGISEDDAFRADVSSRPEPASLDQYAAVPVEEFGAALLRGMGWKEGDVVGKRKNQISKPRVVERRPALLGIGAKETPGAGVGDELGAWGKAAKGRRKVDQTYTPVILKNAKTGEMLTEEELKGKLEDGAKRGKEEEEEDWRARREKNLRDDRDRKARRRSRDGSRDHHSDRDRDRRRRDERSSGHSAPNGSRQSSSRRERSRSSDSSHRRRHDYEDDRKTRDDYAGSSDRRERDGDRDRNRDAGRTRDADRNKERTHLDGEKGGHGSRRHRDR